jgi:hypothetical protein
MRALPLCLIAFVATLAVPPAPAAEEAAPAAEPPAWDQARMIQLAGGLQKAAHDMRNSVRAQPEQGIASGQSYARNNMMDDLRVLEMESKRLKLDLENGKSRDHTYPVFRRLNEVRLNLAEEARRMFLPRSQLDTMKSARAMLEDMRFFYTGEKDETPDLVGPKKDDDAAAKQGGD